MTDEPILSCCFSWCGVPPDAMMTGDKTRPGNEQNRNPIIFIVSRSECRLLARHNTSFCVKYSTIQSSFPSRTEQPSFAVLVDWSRDMMENSFKFFDISCRSKCPNFFLRGYECNWMAWRVGCKEGFANNHRIRTV